MKTKTSFQDLVLLSFVLFTVSLCFLACGEDGEDAADLGDSGLENGRMLSGLTTDERLSLCAWEKELIEKNWGETDCSDLEDETAVYVPMDPEACAEYEKTFNACRVQDRENCFRALAETVCAVEIPAACETFHACVEAEPPSNGSCESFLFCEEVIDPT